MSRIYLTGASGFVGAGLLARLHRDHYDCTVAMRRPLPALPVGVREQCVDSLQGDADLGLAGHEVVIHCAGRAHVLQEQSADPLQAFRAVNVQGTLNVARQAAAAGVKRFIFLSSVKVNGEETPAGQPYTAHSSAKPLDAYGLSKHEAEVALKALGAQTGMEVVIIRPVLVYGPGVRANFHTMMRALAKGLPLPLGAIQNRRSLVALDNLIDLIVACIAHPAAANQTFLVSDDDDLSTSELLRRLGRALGKPARLLPVPAWLLTGAAGALGKGAVARRLCGSLQVDISDTKARLGWAPPVPVDVALQGAASYFLEQQSR